MSTFQLIRLILSAVPAVGVFFLLRAKMHRHRLLWGIPIAVFVLLNIGLCKTPFENLFVTFPSPQAAARYVGMPNAHCVVEGERSGFFTSVDENETTCRIFPKADRGWQLSGESASRFETVYASDGFAVQLWRYRHSEESYLVVFSLEPLQVSDTRGSTFQPLDERGTAYAAYVPDYDGSDYALFVNGQRIPPGRIAGLKSN